VLARAIRSIANVRRRPSNRASRELADSRNVAFGHQFVHRRAGQAGDTNDGGETPERSEFGARPDLGHAAFLHEGQQPDHPGDMHRGELMATVRKGAEIF